MTAKKQGIELLVTRLEDHAQTLLNSADRISGTAFSKDDAYRQLGHVFIGRLTHELRQIREMRQTRDSWLIARSMLEGSMISHLGAVRIAKHHSEKAFRKSNIRILERESGLQRNHESR
jgi:replicative superfamily II helicase